MSETRSENQQAILLQQTIDKSVAVLFDMHKAREPRASREEILEDLSMMARSAAGSVDNSKKSVQLPDIFAYVKKAWNKLAQGSQQASPVEHAPSLGSALPDRLDSATIARLQAAAVDVVAHDAEQTALAYLSEISLQVQSLLQGDLSVGDFAAVLKEAIGKGVEAARISTLVNSLTNDAVSRGEIQLVDARRRITELNSHWSNVTNQELRPVAVSKPNTVSSVRTNEQLLQSNNEHVLYAPKIKIVPDTHGLDPSHYGIDENTENVVCIGDIIDEPKELSKYKNNYDNHPDRQATNQRRIDNGKQFGWKMYGVSSEQEYVTQVLVKEKEEWNRKYDAAKAVNLKRNVEVWTGLMESGKGQVVLGNHELMALSAVAGNDADLSQWLLDANKGRSTLEAFGIDMSQIPFAPIDANGQMTPLDPNICNEIRQKISANQELSKFFDLLGAKGKMYVIANEMLIVHAGVPLDPNGHLIPPQRNGRPWPGFEGVVGLDALDKIEEAIKKRDPDVLHWLGNGSSKEMTPGWVREPFFDVMRNETAAETAIAELQQQAKARQGNVQGIMIGHTENVGGKMVGKRVFGADTAVGDVVNLDVVNKNKVDVQSRHGFGAKQIQYGLSNALP